MILSLLSARRCRQPSSTEWAATLVDGALFKDE